MASDPMKAWRRVRCLAAHLSAAPTPRAAARVATRRTRARRRISLEEVLQKREEGLCWIVIRGKVYDVTEFLDEHPGGAELITDIEPDDLETMDAEFDDAEHSEEALDDMREFYIGRLQADEEDGDSEGDEDEEDSDEEESDDEAAAAHAPQAPLSEAEQLTPFCRAQELELPLLDQHALSEDVSVFRFGLPSAAHSLGLPLGQHLVLSAPMGAGGPTLSRAYTPVSARGEAGFVDVLVKLYPTGKMSQHLRALQPGQAMRARGPKGKLAYLGRGRFEVRGKTRALRRVGMIAGGSGITPMFQLLQAVAADPEDPLEVSLLFANRAEGDIILRDALERLAAERPGKVKLHLTLDQPPPGWPHFSGFVTQEMIRATMPPPGPDSMVFLCGPPPMIKKACVPNLQALGYSRDDYFKF